MSRATDQEAADLPPWPLTATPAGKQERLAAAEVLRGVLPVLGRISTAHVASLCREWWLAGWTPGDIVTALGRRPDGTLWSHGHDIRHIPGWTRHRLNPWRTDPTDPTSPPTRSPTARLTAAAAHTRAADRARRDRLAAEAALVAGANRSAVHAAADTARAALRAAWRPRT